MKTLQLELKDIDSAAAILHRGELVAFPTDTVYGLGVRYDLPRSIERLRSVKQRPEEKPFALMVSSLSMIEALADLSERDLKLISLCFPGDVTLIFRKKKNITSGYFEQAETIAFRMPKDDFVLDLISKISIPLLVPSANISGLKPCTTSDDVLKQFEGLIEAVVVGQSKQNEASTIIDASQSELSVVRQGRIQLDSILKALEED